MMTALATVTQVTPNDHGFEVALSCEQQTSCSSCSSQKSCGTGVVSKAFGNKSLLWHLETQRRLHVGQVVEIGIPEQSLLQSAMLVYLLPIVAMLLGALFGHLVLSPWLEMGEGAVVLTSMLFAFIGILLAKKLAQPLEQKSAAQVELMRVFGEPIA
ncbi:SoxR reducing system RseC family protein [Vibrio vulnificus]|jgi:sigma-E factor negative regulatory protein RseC|uniref:Sigma factor RpoE regulatory protein RseC n=2 Tax=Vibrio vulnificus TaxID=672 RepID=A0A087II75_VIBVL|nr:MULTISPECIES: SoxR reducing system RseC family protein [Vibrio]EWS69147.1 Sigma-E factor regulatory protein [Vibrio vulnificus BAA87]AAO09986.1 Sigma factor RpoE regulatory protein RseC [Vibrio vulnificus CMCP6]ADV85493.1 sigma factor RpoE regulatory protein RseC [Vibrio vulnificus MO6-24/O]AIL71621.1 positive regulator of sigma E activity [Vibrio vulnificus]ARN66959.1 Sigma factor RpoE regulatory protein RseC [Vibrio vulnificus]